LIAAASYSVGHNPLALGTPAAPYTDSTVSGTIQNNKATPSVANTLTTLLNGLAGTNSISANFIAGDTITVNAQTITFMASGAAGNNQVNIGDNIQTLLGKIDALTGTALSSGINAGSITLHSGVLSNLSIQSSNTAAWAALGFNGTMTATRGGGGGIGTGQVVGNDNSTFLNESVAGGAVTTYDVSGAPVNLQFRWAKTDSTTLGPGHTDTWNLYYQVNPNATGTQVAWQNVNTNFTFSASGQMSPAVPSVTLANAVVNGVALGSPVINFGTGGVTQFADANGNVQVNQIQQDGFPAGQLQSVGVGSNGRIVGNYSNGRNLDLAEISVATFNGTNFLKRVNGGAFEITDGSGQALFGKSGTIVGSSLEGSNTDIADEFTKLIVTQQAYSANTKVITTSNTMVQDLLNVLR
jgi:flagellar hook protein FlgE